MHACVTALMGYVEESEDIVGCRVPCHSYRTEELTEDCSRALEKLITVLWMPAGTPT